MTQQQQDNHKNRKLIAALALIIAAVAITTGVIFAFFSDVITGSGSATSGTLDLRGSFKYQVNGQPSGGTAITTSIANLNPGDAVYIYGDITNVGNKSAWLRAAFSGATIDAALKPYIYAYSGNVTQASLLAAENAAAASTAKDTALCAISGYVAGGNGGTGCAAFASTGTTGVGTVQTIQGTGTGAETDGTAGPITVGFTLYFAGYAPNAAQGKTLAISARAEGLQYRNNPSVTLTDTRWSTAESTVGINDTN
ncbi:MAG: hypothetical protein LBU20_01670 [Candidatus Nomurabacteria bacterium]|jgi:hypothetical protein|nr:hypothetical protein [Candidatus Nomurabacteria bacterium]